MNYLDRIRVEPSLGLLILVVGGMVVTIIYIVLASITF